jgi:CBS domain-containing protein
MRIEQIMTKQVRSCRASDTLERAAQLMWDGDCGCLPVCAGDGLNRVVSMITDRDICMSALFQGKALRELPVSSAMATRLLTCKAADAVAGAEKTMREARIRRLPVVDEQGTLIGIIGLADIAHEAVQEHGAAKQDVTETEVCGTLAAICTSTTGQQLAA